MRGALFFAVLASDGCLIRTLTVIELVTWL
jgi:hypothetical protein